MFLSNYISVTHRRLRKASCVIGLYDEIWYKRFKAGNCVFSKYWLSVLPISVNFFAFNLYRPIRQGAVLDIRNTNATIIIIIIIIIRMEKTEAGLRDLCIREIDVKSQILVTEYYSKLQPELDGKQSFQAISNDTPNRVLGTPPPDISPLESLLPRSVRTNLLNSARAIVDFWNRTWPASLLAFQMFVQSVEWHHTL